MDERLQRYLDGELEASSLPPAVREEAESWEALLADVRESGAASAPVGLESRVLGSLADPAVRPGWRRFVEWLIRPRPVRLPPLGGVAAVVAVVMLFILGSTGRDGSPDRVAGFGQAEVVYVQFLFHAPDASSVAIAGDFTDWSPSVSMEDPDGDGIWMARVPLEPGVSEYMFLIDGTRWMTDPNAQRYKNDGYGHTNAVLAVPASATAGL